MFIAGDWGTTSLRLALCDGTRVLDSMDGPGVGRRTEPCDAMFDTLTAVWRATHGPMPAVLCGMVGSTMGWIDAPYAPCPADAGALRRATVQLHRGGSTVSIVPGLSCINPLGAPDVMRGEETQIVGAMALHPPVRSGRQLLVLPGTHTKWVLAAEGAVESFQTSLTGELFALLRDQSSLGRAGPGRNDGAERNGFSDGVARQAAAPPAALLHLLFEARSRQLLQDWARDEAMAYLSGVLIGSDVAAGLQQFGGHSAAVLIGEPALTRRYAEALGAHGVQALALEGTACALAGLHAIFPGIDGGKL